jgi:hexosaminidase
MSWRGTKGGIEAARAGHDVVMAPTTHTYFDYYQSRDRDSEPLAIGGYVPLDTVYAFEPVPQELTAAEARHVLGAQAQLWTEYMKTPRHVEYMAYPRGSALSEVVWSQREARNFDDFMQRLQTHLQRLEAMGVNYRKPK